MSEESVILLEEISSSQADNNSVVQAVASSSRFDIPEEKVAGEGGEESPAGGPEGPNEVGGVCETEACTEADVDEEDEDVDVIGGVDEVGVSGYNSEGFTLSEFFHRKRIAKKNKSEGVVDTIQLPQGEFSTLQHLPLGFLLQILCRPAIEFY